MSRTGGSRTVGGPSDDQHLAAIARAFDVEASYVRSDTPLSFLGWTGSASDWLMAADHLGVELRMDPIGFAEAATVGDVIAMVITTGRGA